MGMENQSIRLRPELKFTVAGTGERYVAEDRTHQKFWRLGVLEYELCAFLEQTILFDEVVPKAVTASRTLSEAGPEKIHKALVWLLQVGLIEVLPTEAAMQTPAVPNSKPPLKLFDPSFFRINLVDGEKIERLTKPLTWLLSYPVLCLSVVLWLVAVVFAYQYATKLAAVGSRMFVPGSQWWFLLAWVILKSVHELGHAVACTKVGIRPLSAGLGFIFFTPSPFVNATNAWNLPNRWSRILVSAAGMLFEVTFASVAMIVGCLSDVPAVQSLCVSMVTLGTISTLAFNGNPLMRFDGYYILIDLLGRPNLWQDASSSFKNLAWRLISKSTGCVESAPLLQSYGILCHVNRILSLSTLAWGLWVAWDGIGLIVVASFGFLWFIVPKLIRRSAQANANRPAQPTWNWTDISWMKVGRLTVVAVGIGALGLLPSPFQIYWPGCIDYVEPMELRAYSPGRVTHVFYHDGQGVRKGDEILRLSNPDLELELANAKIEYLASEEKCNVLRAQKKENDLTAEEANREATRFRYQSFQDKVDHLSIRASRDGVIMIRGSYNLPGLFLQEGHPIGLIVDPSKLEIKASAPADRWETLGRSSGGVADVVISNGEQWQGELVQVLPRTTDQVDFPSLAGIYGGPLTVRLSKSDDGRDQHKSIDPRCQLRIALKQNSFQRSMFRPDYRPNLPSPGVLCSVKLVKEKESVWQTLRRWFYAAINVRFGDAAQMAVPS